MPPINFFNWRADPPGCTLEFPLVAMHDFTFIFILAGAGRTYPEETHVD
jgi:hypothetical protein